jgi:hypothetical protein
MYAQQAQAQQATGTGPGPQQPPHSTGPSGDEFVEGEFREV